MDVYPMQRWYLVAKCKSAIQNDDKTYDFKPYDKVTKSPAHGTLPKWSTSPAVLEKMEKYRAMY